MRVRSALLILIALGPAPAAAADLAARSERPHRATRVYEPRPAIRTYGPLVPLPGVAEQVVVDRGPRMLVESRFLGLFEPVYAQRRLPSRVRRVLIEDDRPWYAP